MSKGKVIICKGIAGSGKSTWAKQQVDTNPSKVKRVNKDDLRNMIDNGIYRKDNEPFILTVRDRIILESVKRGKTVIVDDTNLNPIHERHIRKLVGPFVEVEVRTFFNISVDECIKRDSGRTGNAHVGAKVIRSQYQDWQKWKDVDCSIEFGPVKLEPSAPGLPEAIICDLDGTLAHMTDRSPYQEWLCGSDELDHNIHRILKWAHDDGIKIVLLSGRDAKHRIHTEDWLMKNNVEYDFLFMRPADDRRRDSIVKNEIFFNEVYPILDVKFVLDDRNQVVEEWRRIGLPCLQVAEGDF